jgi:hypothetical protein
MRSSGVAERTSASTWSKRSSARHLHAPADAPGCAGSTRRTSGRSCRAGSAVTSGAGSSADGGATRPAASITVPKPAATRCSAAAGPDAGPPRPPPLPAPRRVSSGVDGVDAELGAAHTQHALRRADAKARLAASRGAGLDLDPALFQPHARARAVGAGTRRDSSMRARPAARRRSTVPSTRRTVTWPSAPVSSSLPSASACPASTARRRCARRR